MKRKFENSEELEEINKSKRLKSYENNLLRNRLYMRKQRNSTNFKTNANLREVKNWNFFHNLAFNYNTEESFQNVSFLNFGEMNTKCSYCGAIRFKREWSNICCANGKVHLDNFRSPPKFLKELLDGNHEFSKHFLTNIRSYNNAFSFTSFGTSVKRPALNGFQPVFKIQGKVYHLMGSLLPPEKSDQPKFAQIYFMDSNEEQLELRMAFDDVLKREIIEKLETIMSKYNSYAMSFKYAIRNLNSDSMKIVINANIGTKDHHPKTLNKPIRNEVAAIVYDYEGHTRDIVISRKDDQLQRITETHRSYDALQYPLIHPFGENGYSIDIHQVNEKGNIILKTVSCKQFYSYRLMIRDSENYLLKFGNLLNQYLVDMYAKIESERLLYIKNNQTKLRVESYIHLKDAIKSEVPTTSIGKLIVLPSTFTGSPRYLQQYTQDAMTYVRNGGKPSLFITYTCNPKNEDLVKNLNGQTSYLRQDLIARIFHQQILIFHDVLIKGKLFGEVKYFVYAVEWQKRGLPHLHILLWFYDLINPNAIDKIICAELPDINNDPELHELVKSHMIPGPCGIHNENCPCMINSKCSKRFPKELVTNTQIGSDGYPFYRRRSKKCGGSTTVINMKRGRNWVPFEVDNRWVVPYNPILLKIFKSHINIEWCKSVASIKYILKYINKGPDYANFKVVNENSGITDEVTNYQTGRYINSNEAAWKIFGFETHCRFPPIQHLDVHLENNERVYFNDRNATNIVTNPKPTTLTAFFKLCAEDNFAKTILYSDVSKYYTFDKHNKIFKKRKQGRVIDANNDIKESNNLSRIYTVNPKDRECYFLRILLINVIGPTSFENLRTVNGVVCETYQEACLKLELIGDDKEWTDAMNESKLCDSPYKMRQLFSIILSFCEISNPKELWNEFWQFMSEDFIYKLNGTSSFQNDVEKELIYNWTYNTVNKIIFKICGKNLTNYLINPLKNNTNIETLSLLIEEKSYNIVSEKHYVQETVKLLNVEQNNIYSKICEKLNNNKTNGIIFIDAPGGTGKTFLLNLILAKTRSEGKIAIAVASSGIASTLLRNGKTAHRTFNLPLNLNELENATCNISQNSDVGKLLKECTLIVWDEAPMMHKNGFEALNNTLKDIRKSQLIMGGVVVILAGDFRQILPIVKGGTRYDEIKACLKNSFLWKNVELMKLTENMRIRLSTKNNNNTYANQLLKIGNGTWTQNENEEIEYDDTICNHCKTLDSLIETIFPNIENRYHDEAWISERSILTLRNESVDEINALILKKIPGVSRIYKSIDSSVDENEATVYPIEFLNSLRHSGIPDHKLELKIGSLIMLMRNLNPPLLCNGTKLIIRSMQKYIIEATILSGEGFGQSVLIPRIPTIPTDIPFKYKRHQFPIKLCYVITFNKCQGQTLNISGIDLRENVFSHGQLYVALSRIGNPENQFLLSSSKLIRNVVYRDVLSEELI